MSIESAENEHAATQNTQEETLETPIQEKQPQLEPQIFLSGLSLQGGHCIGRNDDIDELNSAWENEHPHILTFSAPVGMGKTSVVTHWLTLMEEGNYRGAERIFGWSFQRSASQDAFFHEALAWFGDPVPSNGTPWNKGKRLAELIRTQRSLLVLDGVESLQYASGDLKGRFSHQGVRALLKELGRFNPGLCVITSRFPLKDLEHRTDTSVKQITLKPLTAETGAQLLESIGIEGTPDELRQVSKEFNGHPLALCLANGYLKLAYDCDIRKRYLIPSLSKPAEEGGDVHRVLEACHSWLENTPELNVLSILSLFPFTIDVEAIERLFEKGFFKSLLHKTSIKGLTDKLQKYADSKWNAAVTQLQDAHLVTISDSSQLDCPPFIRKFFGEALQANHPTSWKEAHHRLYDYYKHLPTPSEPHSLQDMEPLLKAVYHGCQADLFQENFEQVYHEHIQRKEEHYLSKVLGAMNTDLALLSHFFKQSWERPITSLSEELLARLSVQVESALLESERWHEAIELLQARHNILSRQENVEHASLNAERLSHCLLLSGRITQAIDYAWKSVNFAEKSENQSLKWLSRIMLAYTLYHAGKIEESTETLQESHRLFQEHENASTDALDDDHHLMVCELLLAQGRHDDVQQRLTQTRYEKDTPKTLRKGIDRLLLGRVLGDDLDEHSLEISQDGDNSAPKVVPDPGEAFEQAVEIFRHFGKQELMIRGVLARAELYRTMHEFPLAWSDLEELQEFAEWNGARLYLAEYHFEAARLLHEEYVGEHNRFSSDLAGEELHQRMHDHLEVAEALLWDTGYRLRDDELERLLTLLKDATPERIEEIEKPKDEEIKRAEVYKQVYLYPGELCIAEEPTVVWTLLGSCVSIALHNKRRKFGAICHAQLPEENYRESMCSDGCSHPCYKDAPDFERFKYVTCAIRYMINQFSQRGVSPTEITVKLFGGSNVLQVPGTSQTVGDKNLEVSRKVIQEYGLKITRESTGGTRGRTLYFYSDTGEVFMKLHRAQE